MNAQNQREIFGNHMTAEKCPHCESSLMEEQTHDKTVKLGRRSIFVNGLLRYICTTCNGGMVTREQFNKNRQATVAAIDNANRNAVGPAYLRGFREKHDLTQKAASELFGAGQSSVAKWESEQTALSTPAALLVRCAAEVPGVVEFLADLSGVVLGDPVVADTPESVPKIYLVSTMSTPVEGLQPPAQAFKGSDPRYVPKLYRNDSVSFVSTAK